MSPRSLSCRVLLSLLASSTMSCASPPVDTAVRQTAVLIGSRAPPAVVSGQRGAAIRLAASPLSSDGCDPTSPDLIAGTVVADVATSDAGRALVTLLVACALPADRSLTVAGTQLAFLGETGLASSWIRGPLDDDGRRWVTGCVLAKLSGLSVEIPVSLRGPRRALRAQDDERAAWTVEEGAFYGDIFTPETTPLHWDACRGTGRPIDRVCAIPDPADPSRTLCGFEFAGECDSACRRIDGDGNRRHCAARDGRVFRQVVTAFTAAP